MPTDLADAVSRVCGNAVTISLFSVSDSDDALAVAIPCDVVYATGDDRVLSFSDAAAIGRAIPHSDYAG